MARKAETLALLNAMIAVTSTGVRELMLIGITPDGITVATRRHNIEDRRRRNGAAPTTFMTIDIETGRTTNLQSATREAGPQALGEALILRTMEANQVEM